jgi:hypothetical protein
MQLDRNAPLLFQIHIVENLFCHIPRGDRAGIFQQPVGKSRFAVIDVCYDAKITNMIHFQSSIH